MKYCIQHNSSIGFETYVYDNFEEARKVFEDLTGIRVSEDADLDAGVRGNSCGYSIVLSHCDDDYEGESEPYCGIDMEEYRKSLI